MTTWSFAAAMPAFVPARRFSCRARSVPAAAFQPRGSGARFHAPVAPVLTDLPHESGDAMPSNIYTARFFNQYPGPNIRFLKISATRLSQDVNCYARSTWGPPTKHPPSPSPASVNGGCRKAASVTRNPATSSSWPTPAAAMAHSVVPGSKRFNVNSAMAWACASHSLTTLPGLPNGIPSSIVCSARSAETGQPSLWTVTKRHSSSSAPPQPLPD